MADLSEVQEFMSLNPLSAGRSFQTLALFFPFVKQRLTRLKYFKLCISKVAVLAHISQFCLYRVK